MSQDDRTRSHALEAATERRIQLKEAVSRTEVAAASPADGPSWRERLATELENLRLALDHHVAEVEGPDGLLAELSSLAPRLSGQIAKVHGEHPELCREVNEAIEHLKESDDVDAVRDDVLDLLVAISRHRQRGADLVYRGYNVDIGSG